MSSILRSMRRSIERANGLRRRTRARGPARAIRPGFRNGSMLRRFRTAMAKAAASQAQQQVAPAPQAKGFMARAREAVSRATTRVLRAVRGR